MPSRKKKFCLGRKTQGATRKKAERQRETAEQRCSRREQNRLSTMKARDKRRRLREVQRNEIMDEWEDSEPLYFPNMLPRRSASGGRKNIISYKELSDSELSDSNDSLEEGCSDRRLSCAKIRRARVNARKCLDDLSESDASLKGSDVIRQQTRAEVRLTRVDIEKDWKNSPESSDSNEVQNGDNGQRKRIKKTRTRNNAKKYFENLSESSRSSDQSSVDGRRTGKRTRKRSRKHFKNDRSLSNRKVEKISDWATDIPNLEGVCLICGTCHVFTKHPFLVGGLCEEHAVLAQEKIYRYDMKGYASTCSVCFMGGLLVICSGLDCGRCCCKGCLDRCVNSGAYKSAVKDDNWKCFLCKNFREGLLEKRPDWRKQIVKLFESTERQFPPFPIPSPISANERRPIRVLSLFDGIATGILALQQLGIEIDKFVASEINDDAIRLVRFKHPQIIHVRNVTQLTEDELQSMGPFDLLLGGSTCNDLSAVNPYRKGLLGAEGSGTLFFEYLRILNTVRPPSNNGSHFERPFFWLFENIVSMTEVERLRISRFLKCEPRMADASSVSAASKPRFYWGNLPELKKVKLMPAKGDCLTVQDGLDPGGKSPIEKLNSITAKFSCLPQGGRDRAPVTRRGEKDVLQTNELERVFGVPEHYTDNLGPRGRIALLGRSWSVPVLKQFLTPLRNYFKSRD